jgi:hypothetical protein
MDVVSRYKSELQNDSAAFAEAAMDEKISEAELGRSHEQLSDPEYAPAYCVVDTDSPTGPDLVSGKEVHEAFCEIEALDHAKSAFNMPAAANGLECDQKNDDAERSQLLVPDWKERLAAMPRFQPEPTSLGDAPGGAGLRHVELVPDATVNSPHELASLRMRAEPAAHIENAPGASVNYGSGTGAEIGALPWRWRTPASRGRSRFRSAIIRIIGEGLAFAVLAAAAILVYSGGYRIVTALQPQLTQLQAVLRMPDLLLPAGSGAPPVPVTVGPITTIDIEANLHTGPSTGTAIMSVLSPGAQVQELESQGLWTRVRLAAVGDEQLPIEGWVASRLLKAPDPER